MDRRVVAFLPAAGIWFGAGALIGLLMAVAPQHFLYLRPAHIVINVFGWMSMLMFAMTYVVIPVFIRRQLHRPALVTAHWVVANGSVLVILLGHWLRWPALVPLGWVGLTLGGTLFLVNIMGAALRGAPATDWEERSQRLTNGAVAPDHLRSVDRAARPFTQVSVVYLIAGSLWTALDRLGWVTGEAAAAFLIRYGWMAMLAFGTACHMLPRLSGRVPASARPLRWHFVLLNLGVVLAFFGTQFGRDWLARPGVGLIGLVAIGHAAYVADLVLRPGEVSATGPVLRGVPRAFVAGSWVALVAAGLVGLGWAGAAGAAPYTWFLGQTHLYLLGWMTLLAYGVGGALLPVILQRPLALRWLYTAQLGLALPGVALVAASFLARTAVDAATYDVLFGSGAVACAAAALMFGGNVALTVTGAGAGRIQPP